MSRWGLSGPGISNAPGAGFGPGVGFGTGLGVGLDLVGAPSGVEANAALVAAALEGPLKTLRDALAFVQAEKEKLEGKFFGYEPFDKQETKRVIKQLEQNSGTLGALIEALGGGAP